MQSNEISRGGYYHPEFHAGKNNLIVGPKGRVFSGRKQPQQAQRMPHLIIDGYNLIRHSRHLSHAEHHSLERGRLALMKQLVHYRQIKGYPVTVVFDAALTDNNWVEEDRQAGIQIFYSEQGQKADEIIISLSEQKKEAALVISSDREIMKAARRFGSGVLTSEEFLRVLAKASSPLSGQVPLKEDPVVRKPYNKKRITQKKGPSKRLPKSKRQALAKITKFQ